MSRAQERCRRPRRGPRSEDASAPDLGRDAWEEDAGAGPSIGASAADASARCDPAAMPTLNAGLREAPGAPGCLPGMTMVAAFCIDLYEAALVPVAADGSMPQGYIDALRL